MFDSCVCVCALVQYAISSQRFCVGLVASVITLVFAYVCVSRSGGRMQRAEPWQLRQENSDAVWNELTYMKNLTRKLSIEKWVNNL